MSVCTYVGGNPISNIDPLGLWNVVVGVGGSVVGGVGGEASVSAYASSYNGNAEVGIAGSVGGGAGLNISADAYVGYIPGGANNISGETVNYNVGVGPLSITIMTNPATGGVRGYNRRPRGWSSAWALGDAFTHGEGANRRSDLSWIPQPPVQATADLSLRFAP